MASIFLGAGTYSSYGIISSARHIIIIEYSVISHEITKFRFNYSTHYTIMQKKSLNIKKKL